MANKRLPELSTLTTPASGDLLYGVDISDTTDHSSGSSYEIPISYFKGIDVTTYGADKTGVADSTAAIQAAIDAASVDNAAGQAGQAVYLPFGLYLISSTLDVPNRVRIVGSAARGAVIKADAAFVGTHMIEFANGVIAMFSTGLEYLSLDCNAVVGLSGVLHNAPHENTDFKNITIGNFDTYGIEIQNAYQGASHWLVTNSELFPNVGATGIYIDATDNFATTLIVSGLTINSNPDQSDIGIHLFSKYAMLHAVGYHAEFVTDMVYVEGTNCRTTMINCRGQDTVTTMLRHLDGGNNRWSNMIGCSKWTGTNFFSDGSYTETRDIDVFRTPHYQAFSGDATPSVGNQQSTIQIGASATPVTNFDDAVNGQEWLVIFPGISTIDFSANANLVGNGGSDFVSAAGDGMWCRHHNGVTYCFIADKA